MIRHHVAALVAGILLVGLIPAQDLIRLKGGATFEGTIVEQDASSVVLEFEGGTMTFARNQIASIKVAKDPTRVAAKKALMTLSRFPDHESFHYLYRDGRRVGYRTMSIKREAQDGVPGYVLRDRLVFMERPGAQPDVDLLVSEFVDAELRPLFFSTSVTSGPSSRLIKGDREGLSLVMKERSAGKLYESTALFRKDVEFPRMLLRRLAGEPPPEGGYPEFRVFRPRDATFGRVSLARHVERIGIRGRIRDVLVFRRKLGERLLETWLDMSGHVIREELGSPRLVSLRAAKSEVLGFARGDGGPEGEDLGLEVVSESTGLRFLRPDLAWELIPGERRGAVASLLRPGLRATVDVLRIDNIAKDATEEGIALNVLSRMERQSTEFRSDGAFPARIGDRSGLRWSATCYRRGSRVRTLGALVLDQQGHAFVILCAAPELNFKAAKPAFLELFQSVRFLTPLEDLRDPFDLASGGMDGK